MTDEEIIRLFLSARSRRSQSLPKRTAAPRRAWPGTFSAAKGTRRECLNDTYLAVWNAIPPQKPDPLRTFVCKIARNLAAAEVPRQHREKAKQPLRRRAR